MADDYRATDFCPKLDNIDSEKQNIVKEISKEHPGAEDMHAYISPNDGPYKLLFMKAYNYKCAYCGSSIDIIPKEMFEIDHYIYQKSFPSKAKAGHIENLVLACHTCNHQKGSLPIPEDHQTLLNPDKDGIKSAFIRDSQFYIKISDKYSNDETVKLFYKQIGLGDEIRRLDYLLMSMIAIQPKVMGKPEVYVKLGQAISKLRKKRNMI